MRDEDLLAALRRLKVETGSLVCLGCGYEHNCGIHGCAILRKRLHGWSKHCRRTGPAASWSTGMSAKVNPRRVPRTEADVATAYTKGVTEGLNRGIELMLYVLIDKHDAPMEDVQQLAAELNHAAECVAEGYVTWAGVRRMLKEYNVEVELV